MNRDEMVDLLSLIAARDNRQVGETTVAVWLEDIGDLDFRDARTAVSDHFRNEPGVWLMAGHVRARVKAIRENRLGPGDGAPASPLPPPADPDDPKAYMLALRAQQKAIADGREQVPAIEGGAPTGYDDNPHVQRILAAFKAEQDAAAAHKAAEAAAERDHVRAYVAAVQTLLALPDRGRAAIEAARDELYSDEQAAKGLPLLAATAGVHDEHKVTVHAARLVAQGRAA